MEYDTSPRNCAGRTPSSRPGPLPGVAAVTYDPTTPFPGAWALLPVGGTARVSAAAAAPGSGPGRLLGVRPAQFLGDVSYSIYLWHWPLVVFAPYVLGPLEWWHLVGLAVVTVLLAALTKTWVEAVSYTHLR